jgi:hypothetical protein
LDAHRQDGEELKNEMDNSEVLLTTKEKVCLKNIDLFRNLRYAISILNTIKTITLDCYDLKLPDFLAIDWEETAQNCSVDGYGNTFASY